MSAPGPKLRIRGQDVPIVAHGYEVERYERDPHEGGGFGWRILRGGKLEAVTTSRKGALDYVGREIYRRL